MIESTGQRPTLAVVLNRDLLFGSRIRSALKNLGLDARFVTTTEEFVGALREQPQVVAIGIIDMNGGVSWNVIHQGLPRPSGDRSTDARLRPACRTWRAGVRPKPPV